MIGKKFKDYEIVEKIGAGGMAVVFKARHEAMGRDVAIKFMPEGMMEDDTARHRFIREARTIARLEHPHILPVYDFGEVDGRAFLVMRLLSSGTLGDLIRKEGAMPFEKIVALISQVADALQYAHHQGVIHRDVKPANLLMDTFGKVYLTDFGIAKVFESQQQITQTGATMGTPTYMSPEQVQAGEVDARSDIYSLGIIVYQMLVGQVPFSADTPIATALKHVSEMPPIPSDINPDIPYALEQVVLKALAKDKEDRYQSCAEFVQALQAAVGTEQSMPAQSVPPAQSSPTPQPAPASRGADTPKIFDAHAPDTTQNSKKKKREINPLLWVGLGVVLVAVVFFGVLMSDFDFSSSSSSSNTDQNSKSSSSRNDEEKADEITTDDSSADATNDSGSNAVDGEPDTQDESAAPAATKTSAPKPTATQDASFPEYYPISGCAPSRVFLGELAYISFGNSGNALRKTADLRASDNFVYVEGSSDEILAAEPGELFTIIGGPECDTGWIMWKIRIFSGQEGWTPEKDNQPDSDFWFTPVESHAYCSDAPRSFLQVGDTAIVSLFPGGNSRVRTSPTGDRIGTVAPGEAMNILSGPECSGGYVWWEIKSLSSGLSGWMAEGDKEDYWIVVVP